MSGDELKTAANAHSGRSQEDGLGDATPLETLRSERDQVLHELTQAQTKQAETWDQLLRLRAEMDNVRKRNSKDLEDAHKFALERFVQELLPVRDSMEMGLSAASVETTDMLKIKEGTELTLRMLVVALEKFGVNAVDPQPGDKLNPQFHQAMMSQEHSSALPNSILHVVQKGFTLNERLVRPALVIVAKAPQDASSSDSSNST